jgi:ribosomal protein S18 acetylase RimI-like enzyme
MVTVRRAVAADVPALRSIVDDAFLPYVPRIGRAPGPVGADYAAAVARGETYVAVEAGPAGTGGPGGDPGPVLGLIVLEPQDGYLQLETIAVRPATQGRGIGGCLLAFTEVRAGELGLPEIRLCTNVAMTENLAYYPRRGYTEINRARQDGYNRVFFRKRLSAT